MTTPLALARRLGGGLLALTLTASGLLLVTRSADAANSPTVPLATSANYAVLGATTVTNTNASVLNGSLGLSPGTSITGFPPGIVVPPGTTDTTNAAAAQAQAHLTAAYLNAEGRSLDATTTADLANLTLQAGVYAGPSKGALGLTGPLTLDGAGDPSSVFIFQTNSTLTTGSSSTVLLINGAQACNVFWQVGSSATLGSSSVFAGNILALTSITVNNSVTVRGRALARNGAVTLDNDTFIRPSCDTTPVTTTTTTTAPAITTTTAPDTAGTVTGTGPPTGTPSETATGTSGSTTTPERGSGEADVPAVVGPPRTGGAPLRPGATPGSG
jgi:hypothetical protein